MWGSPLQARGSVLRDVLVLRRRAPLALDATAVGAGRRAALVLPAAPGRIRLPRLPGLLELLVPGQEVLAEVRDPLLTPGRLGQLLEAGGVQFAAPLGAVAGRERLTALLQRRPRRSGAR